MRNFARINNYYNRIAAWEDWHKLAAKYPEAAKLYAPRERAGWRKVDSCIAMLRTHIEIMGLGDEDATTHPGIGE